jgi:phosphoribosylaminoimidazolecarboxamide formyltransferase/IMP cyclohydrolase
MQLRGEGDRAFTASDAHRRAPRLALALGWVALGTAGCPTSEPQVKAPDPCALMTAKAPGPLADERAKTTDPLALAKFSTPAGEPGSAQVGSMSWVNLKDLSRGLEAITRIAAAYEANVGKVPMIAVLIDHGNACGAACGTSDNVINLAIQANYRAAMGSFLVTNVALSEPVAYKVRQWLVANRPLSGIAAPLIDAHGAAYFERKSRSCHMLANPALGALGRDTLQTAPIAHTIRGATLTQSPNTHIPKFPSSWSPELIADMCLAWGVAASSASNSITIAKDGVLIANAVGQQDRVAACELAVLQVRSAKRTASLKGAAVVSDSFFPFADGLDYLARRKVAAIFATSGSVNDKEVAEHAAQFPELIFHTVPDREGRMFSGH